MSTGAPSGDEHAACLPLLPWYANGSLGDDEQARVGAHLEGCGRCRTELAFLRELEIAALALDAELAAVTRPADAPPQRRGRWRWAWRLTPLRVRWLVAGQAAVLATLALVVALPVSVPAPPVFRTLTDAPTEARGRLQLVVTETTPEARLRALLLANDLVIVDGPSAIGVYVLETRGEGNAAAVADRLAGHGEVRLVAPLP